MTDTVIKMINEPALELRLIAKELGLRGYYKLKRLTLQFFIRLTDPENGDTTFKN